MSSLFDSKLTVADIEGNIADLKISLLDGDNHDVDIADLKIKITEQFSEAFDAKISIGSVLTGDLEAKLKIIESLRTVVDAKLIIKTLTALFGSPMFNLSAGGDSSVIKVHGSVKAIKTSKKE